MQNPTLTITCFICVLAVGAPAMEVQAGGSVLTRHSIPFVLENTGGGVADGRLRFYIDTLAVPGEDYYIDNVTLMCPESEVLTNGDFGSGFLPWRFFTNASAPKPVAGIDSGMLKISFGSDGSNTQFFQKNLELPQAGIECLLEFDACSTGGPGNPGFGHNLGIALIKHGPPHTKYGLDLHGNPPNPEISIHSCNAMPECGNGVVESGEDCDDADSDDEDGCKADCSVGSFCGDGTVDTPNDAGQDEACDNGGGTPGANTTTMADANCDVDCTLPRCGDGLVNHEAGEQCESFSAVFGGILKGTDPGSCDIEDFCDSDCTYGSDELEVFLVLCIVPLTYGDVPDECCELLTVIAKNMKASVMDPYENSLALIERTCGTSLD